MHVIVIGGGFAGLTAARTLLKEGVQVTLFEKDSDLGGMASSFLWDEVWMDRFYHFLCRGDKDLVNLIKELGLSSRLHWRFTSMSLNHRGTIYRFGTAWDLFRLPLMDFKGKIRFGWGVVRCRLKRSWCDLEDLNATEWLKRSFGMEGFKLVHEPLITRKFGSHANHLSAAWMWARIHRLGRSRLGLLQRETLGYIEGGTRTLVQSMAKEIQDLGGTLLVNQGVEELLLDKGRVQGVRVGHESFPADAVLSTIPLPLLPELCSELPDEFLAKIRAVPYIGVVCALFRMKTSLSGHFWTNICDPHADLAGIIEYTNLDPKEELDGHSLIYLPRYVPAYDPVYEMMDEQIADHAQEELKKLYPLKAEDFRDWHVFRSPYAQPICQQGFTKDAVQIRSPLSGLYVTDSCLLHPSDRTLSDTVALAQKASRLILSDFPSLISRISSLHGQGHSDEARVSS